MIKTYQQGTIEATRPQLWSSGQVADYLGKSRRTIYRLVASRKLTEIRLDGDLRFRVDDVERFLEKRTLRAA